MSKKELSVVKHLTCAPWPLRTSGIIGVGDLRYQPLTTTEGLQVLAERRILL